MNTIADIVRIHAPRYLADREHVLPTAHRRVITSILDCRTDALGKLRFYCNECGMAFDLSRSCGNRHCPTCGKAKGSAWLKRRLDQLLPVPHFMITFTVPGAFRSVFLHHQRLCYRMLCRASSSLLARLGGEQTYFGGDTPGFLGVLHTWGRTLSYHPHIHYIVPAGCMVEQRAERVTRPGAFDSRTHQWHSCPTAFYVPVRVLSKLMKARMFAGLRRAGLLSEVPPNAFEKDWNVDCRPVGSGVRALRYLSAYVFRAAISDKRLVEVTERTVTFAYTDTKTGTNKRMTLSGDEFLRRFLQHVLPSGFMRIRYYGFLHPCSAIPLKLAVALLEAVAGIPARTSTASQDRTRVPVHCPACNGDAALLYFAAPTHRPSNSGFT